MPLVNTVFNQLKNLSDEITLNRFLNILKSWNISLRWWNVGATEAALLQNREVLEARVDNKLLPDFVSNTVKGLASLSMFRLINIATTWSNYLTKNSSSQLMSWPGTILPFGVFALSSTIGLEAWARQSNQQALENNYLVNKLNELSQKIKTKIEQNPNLKLKEIQLLKDLAEIQDRITNFRSVVKPDSWLEKGQKLLTAVGKFIKTNYVNVLYQMLVMTRIDGKEFYQTAKLLTEIYLVAIISGFQDKRAKDQEVTQIKGAYGLEKEDASNTNLKLEILKLKAIKATLDKPDISVSEFPNELAKQAKSTFTKYADKAGLSEDKRVKNFLISAFQVVMTGFGINTDKWSKQKLGITSSKPIINWSLEAGVLAQRHVPTTEGQTVTPIEISHVKRLQAQREVAPGLARAA